ncbi:hypothetical protein Agub_g16072 [Astrephomene gubernaculifera]|uniref:Hexosyltransferase n=1 Tax=Astrephomene gubernaculifera TaxID=47775 RepID=A0AAD3E5T0_9CHLO|nr:hypothetical protein Agub_g16072 [Astrephomene gubernaculifera]
MLLRRRVAALMVVALVSTLSTAAKGQSGGSLRRLTEALLRKSVTQASDGIIPAELVARQFIPPLWSTTDRDVIPSVGKHIGRSPKQAQGDELSNGAADPDPDPHPNPTRRTLRNDDFVYTAPCTPQRLPLAQASRYWRKGMRAVFVMDEPTGNLPKEVTASANKYRESYAWFPNFRRMANDKRDHYLEGDRRAAMTPVLAYAALADPAAMTPWTQLPSGPRSSAAKPTQMASDPSPTPTGAAASSGNGSSADPFQWLLVGDDDTIFFMRGVKALLRDYDPQLPYFLSDSMYVGSKSPQPGVWEMRCYPCHMQWGRWRRRAGRRLMATADGGREVQQAKGCGCSTENLCKRRFPGNETRCQQEWEGPVPWGGVGFIFSIGFFKQLAASQGGTGLRAYEVRPTECRPSVARLARIRRPLLPTPEYALSLVSPSAFSFPSVFPIREHPT